MDSKKKAIKKLKAACQIAMLFKSPEAMAVGTLKTIDVLDLFVCEPVDNEQIAHDIEDAGFMILKIIYESLNERHAAGEAVEDYFWDIFHAVGRMAEKFESPIIIKTINRICRDLDPPSPN